MPEKRPPCAVVVGDCPLQKGVATAMTQLFYKRGGDICGYDQYVDHSKQHFFARLEWQLSAVPVGLEEIRRVFAEEVAAPFGMNWGLWSLTEPVRVAVFVSKEVAHLYDLLMRSISGLWNATVVLIISNHQHLESEGKRFGVEFHHLPVDQDNKSEQEDRQLELLQDLDVELVVLARYMQIVTEKLIEPFQNRIINIHHSMLPAFAGAKPYQQAHDRGVKLIGATSHYVTEKLDAGPIVAQDVVPVDHRKTVAQLIELGRDLETRVLARAVRLHVDRRIWVHEGRTIIFD